MDNNARQLELVADTFRLPSPAIASFAPHGLDISPDATEADLVALGSRIFAVRSWTKWGLGSVFAAMMRARPHPDTANHPGEFDTTWASEFADAHHLDPKERREMMGVYLFYRGGSPTPALSFEHHREAMWGATVAFPDEGDTPHPVASPERGASSQHPGGVSLARPPASTTKGTSPVTTAGAYLLRAASDGLSVTQLRAHIRTSRQTEKREQRELALAGYSVVFDFHRFAARELPLVAAYSPERARLVISDLGQTSLDYIAALQRAATITLT
jgi:hypothetical protein